MNKLTEYFYQIRNAKVTETSKVLQGSEFTLQRY